MALVDFLVRVAEYAESFLGIVQNACKCFSCAVLMRVPNSKQFLAFNGLSVHFLGICKRFGE